MDSFGFACLLPVVFSSGEGAKIVVCESAGFSAGDAFADLEVACPDDEGRIAVVGVGVLFGFWWLPVG